MEPQTAGKIQEVKTGQSLFGFPWFTIFLKMLHFMKAEQAEGKYVH